MTTGATRVTAQTAATQTAGTQTAAAPALRSRAGRPPGMLVCADGESFGGEWVGPATVASGEVVFNTAMSGYQEVLTDPSYAGQVVAFTYPHIGNYGVAARDAEGRRPWARAVVVRELAPRPSSWRSEHDLAGYLAAGYSKTGAVGTFGGAPYPTVTIFMDGFKQGVEYYNSVKGTTVKV
ncbi:MAG: BMP family ABC transporter substrate-binding protein, partial [Actinomycetota bacterium]|nr:BMP family ABC transporter substrate-binding protein [Actinomycetota bacterium]